MSISRRAIRVTLLLLFTIAFCYVVFSTWLIVPFAYFGINAVLNIFAPQIHRWVDAAPRATRAPRQRVHTAQYVRILK